MIEHRKTLVNSFRVKIIAEGILIGEFGPQSIVLIPVGPVEHQTRKEFFADSSSGRSQFDFSRIVGIRTQTIGMHGLELLGDEGWNYPDSTNTPISSNSFNMRHKSAVISGVINTILLIVCKKELVRGNRGHDTLRLGIVRAA